MSTDEVVYHHAPKVDEVNETTSTTVEQSDRGLFDFMKSKKTEEETKCEDAAISSEFDQKVQLSEPEPKAEEKKHETLFQKMHESHSGSSSSSSSDEECEDGEKKKKKKEKKSLTTQIKEKIEERKEKKEEEKVEKHEDDTCVPIEKYEEVAAPPHVSEVAHPIATPEPEEKKGFMEKLREKLPGGHKKVEEEYVAPPPPTPVVEAHDEDKEKKGIFEKIKEKIPGYDSKSEEEKEKEKVKECD